MNLKSKHLQVICSQQRKNADKMFVRGPPNKNKTQNRKFKRPDLNDQLYSKSALYPQQIIEN